MKYWDEVIEEALSAENIVATKEQIKNIAGSVEVAHDCHGMAHGYDCIPNPAVEENKRLSHLLEQEKDKKQCKNCNGTGREISYGPCQSSDTQCWICNGEGKVRSRVYYDHWK